MNELFLRLKSGVSLAVPPTLGSMTTYVLLEQEDWFEKELGFLLRWLRPGMTVIDIGANVGVYSLPLARRVAPHGHVFAYEPGSAPRTMLERSRTHNRADNLHIIPAAVSDSPREGQLVLGVSSELNSLQGSGPGEPVQITSLDMEEGTRGWDTVDFIKIDAEGEEERILAGAKSFFERHSPLVMFEVKDDDVANETLRAAFPQRGYNVYRMHPGAMVLVADNAANALDRYELNLFAAKPDRAAALAKDGLLLDWVPNWVPDADAREKALDLLKAQAFAPAFSMMFAGEPDANYRDAIAAYAMWRSPQRSLAQRIGALDFACRTLFDLCRSEPTIGRLSTLARATWEAGQRGICLIALKSFAEMVARGAMNVSEPFWPASARFDGIDPGAQRAPWLLASAFEHLERVNGYSSIFVPPEFDLDWLCAQPFVASEMERRRVLRRLAAGEQVEVPARLCVPADDHLNAEVWRAGLVPGTRVGEAAKVG
jgi:FkbM family methyltransferase